MSKVRASMGLLLCFSIFMWFPGLDATALASRVSSTGQRQVTGAVVEVGATGIHEIGQQSFVVPLYGYSDCTGPNHAYSQRDQIKSEGVDYLHEWLGLCIITIGFPNQNYNYYHAADSRYGSGGSPYYVHLSGHGRSWTCGSLTYDHNTGNQYVYQYFLESYGSNLGGQSGCGAQGDNFAYYYDYAVGLYSNY